MLTVPQFRQPEMGRHLVPHLVVCCTVTDYTLTSQSARTACWRLGLVLADSCRCFHNISLRAHDQHWTRSGRYNIHVRKKKSMTKYCQTNPIWSEAMCGFSSLEHEPWYTAIEVVNSLFMEIETSQGSAAFTCLNRSCTCNSIWIHPDWPVLKHKDISL